MPHADYLIDVVGGIAGSPFQLLQVPAKAEGRSMKAVLIHNVRLYKLARTYVTGNNNWAVSINAEVPTRWADALAHTIRTSAGSISIPILFGPGFNRTAVWIHGERTTADASANPLHDDVQTISYLPALVVADRILLHVQSTGIAALEIYVDMEYEFIDVDEFTWNRLLDAGTARA